MPMPRGFHLLIAAQFFSALADNALLNVTIAVLHQQGQFPLIQRMVDEEAYCMDILKQVKAVQQALERVSALTLENHLHTCVTTAMRSDDQQEQERVIGEIMDVFKATGKM